MDALYHSVTWFDDEHRRRYLRDLASRYAALPSVRRYTLRVLRAAAVPSQDTEAAIRAVFDWVRRMVPYHHEYGEQIELPTNLLKNPTLGADCDGHALLVASMLASIAIPTRLAFYRAGAAGHDVHVSAQARNVLDWVNLDTTQNKPLGWQPVGYTMTVTGNI